MDLQLTKMELIEMLLSTQNISVLKKVKAILEEDQDHLTETDYKIIDERREHHLREESPSYSWDEVKKNILEK